jgi:ParB family transcriptional regulator, chromosome partitioning protein
MKLKSAKTVKTATPAKSAKPAGRSAPRAASFLSSLVSTSLAEAQQSGVLTNTPADLLKARAEAPPSAAGSTSTEASLTDSRAGRVIAVPLEQIDENPDNSRVFYDENGLIELAHNLHDNGQLEPAPAYAIQGGRYQLAGGHRRLRAARLAQIPTLRLLLREAPKSRLERIKLCRDLNGNREDPTILDDAVLWQRYLKEQVFADQAQLATYLKVSVPYVSKALAIASLPAHVLRAVRKHEAWVAPGRLYRLSQLMASHNKRGDDGTAKVLKLVVDNPDGLTERDLDARKARVDESRALPPRARPDRMVFDGPTGRGALKRFDSEHRLELRLDDLPVDVLDRLTVEIGAIVKQALETQDTDEPSSAPSDAAKKSSSRTGRS